MKNAFTCVITAREGDLQIIIQDPDIIGWDVDSGDEGGRRLDLRDLAGVHHVHPDTVPGGQISFFTCILRDETFENNL